MKVVRCRAGEVLIVETGPEPIRVNVKRITPGRVVLGVEASPEMRIRRGELADLSSLLGDRQ